MVRLGSVALLALALPVAAPGKPPPEQAPAFNRSFFIPQVPRDFSDPGDRGFGRAQISPNAQFGFGMFGLKPEKSPLRPVTVREIDTPKQRRAAVGFSVRF